MRSCLVAMLLAAWVSVAGAGAAGVKSQSGDIQFAGCSAGTGTGGQGLWTLNQLCQDAFGPAARMCSTADVRDYATPSAAGEQCWIRPVLAVHTLGGDNANAAAVDQSGASSIVPGSAAVAPGTLSCDGWSTLGATVFGLTIDSGSGRLLRASCGGSDFRPVACCAPSQPERKKRHGPHRPGASPPR